MVAASDADSAPITLAGWLGPEQTTNPRPPCPERQDGKVVLSFYGMSFAQNLGKDISRRYGNVSYRFWGGPGAPANHTFAAFLADRDYSETDVSVFSILASDVPGIMSTTGATRAPEIPAPFMYPRYYLAGGELKAASPPCDSLSEFREILDDASGWESWIEFLSVHDAFYSPFVFRQSLADLSSLACLVRRGYGISRGRRNTETLHGPNGFRRDAPDILALRRILHEFATESRNRGQIPVVCLLNNRGYGQDLFDLLHEQLETDGIPYLSSHYAAPPTDPTTFGPDGYHFSTAANARIADDLVDLLQSHGVELPPVPSVLQDTAR